MFFYLPLIYSLTYSSCVQGVYYQIGDVIKVVDEDDGKAYYAQIRGFVQDQYCEKSAALTWLIPTQASPRDRFDPATYIVGECMQKYIDFVPRDIHFIQLFNKHEGNIEWVTF